jgi:two-component system, LytTR family, sensor kinase
MQSSFWDKEILGGVKMRWLAGVIGFYFFSYLTYVLTLAFNEMAYEEVTFLELLSKYAISQAFDYTFKFLLTIPLCYLYFHLIKNWHFALKIGLHVFTMIAFVLIWQKTFYATMDFLDRGHLSGSSQVWDLYIPALFYVIQFSLFHAFEYYYQFQKQKDTEHQLRQISLQNELSAIKAQLNPHFLYNVFNTISASVPPEQERTREMIAELADLFRYQLKASRTELVCLRDEIEFLEKYLDLEKARFGDRLVVKMDIDKTLLDDKVPSMMIQPIVENCLKHGLASKIEGGEVTVSIKKRGDLLNFEVKDTGVGVEDKSKLLNTVTPSRDEAESIKGVGLKNTQLRLEKLYHSKLVFEDNQPTGLIVRFDLNNNLLDAKKMKNTEGVY